MKSPLKYFTKTEIILWSSSVLLIIISFFIFDRTNYFTLAASIVGVASLIFCAKGNPAGQGMMIVFSIMYGIISYTFSYYGEMITYLGMTMPMAIMSLASWLRHPAENGKREVKVNRLTRLELLFAIFLTLIVTVGFYFILKAFGTANLIPSTVSVATSFLAAYLTFCRSPWYPAVYAANDIVLILLWIFATAENIGYLSVIVCFIVFLANDLYGFLSWRKMEKRQRKSQNSNI